MVEILKVGKSAREELKTLSEVACEQSISQLVSLVMACFTITLQFFENLKKQLKKSEMANNFSG